MAPLSARQLQREAELDDEMRRGYPSYSISEEERDHYAHGPEVDEHHLPQSARPSVSVLETTEEREAA